MLVDTISVGSIHTLNAKCYTRDVDHMGLHEMCEI